MSATKILWGQIIVVFLIVLATTWSATQYVAWQLGFGRSRESFEWQSTTAADSSSTVPDGGSTVAFLGAGLCGLSLLRKKLTAEPKQ